MRAKARIFTGILLGLSGLAGWPALAGPFDGVYRQTATSDCSEIGVEGGALKIEDGRFFGVQSQCRMRRPVSVRDMDATLYDMECEVEPVPVAEPEATADPEPEPGGVPDLDAPPKERVITVYRPWTERALLMQAADGGLIMVWNGYAFKYDRCGAQDVIDSAIEAQQQANPVTDD